MNKQKTTKDPLLMRFRESEKVQKRPLNASPERGGESNPIEEAPRPEPTKKTPYGD